MLYRTFALALLLALAAAPPASAQGARNYLVGPQDVLAINVWASPDLSGKYTVEADGSFTFPLIGRVKAGGLTLREVEEELKRLLADGYFKNPQVSVAIEQHRSQRIFVVGEVRSPGALPLTGDMTLIEALARAGSTTPSAGTEALIVRRAPGHDDDAPVMPNGHGAAEVVRVDLEELQSGGLKENHPLQDGDTIFVPRAETVYVFGEVRSPGNYAIKKDTTVLQALSLAGGVTPRGSTNRIRIIRIVDGKKKEINAKLDDLLQPGDTIVVRERYF
jgi:polysaccharide biosynthesis/export protein